MNLELKIEKLKNETLKSARDKANHIIDEQNLAIEKLKHEYEAKHKALIKANIDAKTNKLIQDDTKLITKETLKLRRDYNLKLSKYTDEIFDKVKLKLTDFMETSEYLDLLTSWIAEALEFADGDNICIYINESDLDKKEILESKCNTELTISAYDFIGGTRAVIRSRNVLIDHAFLSLLDNEKKIFHIEKGEEHV